MDGAGEVPLIDGLPATYNQSLEVTMRVDSLKEDEVVYRIEMRSALTPEPWTVTNTYEDVRPSQARPPSSPLAERSPAPLRATPPYHRARRYSRSVALCVHRGVGHSLRCCASR